MSSNESNQTKWQNKYLIGGGVIGAVLGVLTAYLLVRTADQKHGRAPQISGVDVLKTSVGVIGLMRGIATLGE